MGRNWLSSCGGVENVEDSRKLSSDHVYLMLHTGLIGFRNEWA